MAVFGNFFPIQLEFSVRSTIKINHTNLYTDQTELRVLLPHHPGGKIPHSNWFVNGLTIAVHENFLFPQNWVSKERQTEIAV